MNVAPGGARPAPLGWVLALTAAASLIVALDQLVVATALQSIARNLDASMASLEWTVSAFSLSFAALMIPSAELAPDIGLLITARVVQGAGAALVTPAALALLTAGTPPASAAVS
jgi:MFS family permease